MTKAFLIGAGATKAQYATAPLCNDFFQRLSEKNNKLFNFLKNAVKTHINRDIEKLNIEYVMKLYDSFPETLKTQFMVSIYRAIYDLLAKTTGSLEGEIRTAMQRANVLYVTHFQTLLLDPRIDETDFFMTLNYDLYLDREVLTIEKKIDYGIDPKSLYHDYAFKSNEQNFSVYHLHGALNWRNAGNKIQVEIGAIEPVQGRKGSNLCIVPPGRKALELYPAMQTVWKTAEYRLLNEANELVVIGCSLNPGDKELCNLVKKFVDKNGSKNVTVIYNINNDMNYVKIDQEYMKIIKGPFKVYRNGLNNNAIEFILKK